VPNFL